MPRPPFDLVLEGATLFDGSGGRGRRADVAVLGDRIAAVGGLSGAPARRRISLEGRWLTPGFVDVHAHSDFTALAGNRAASKTLDGVTTEVSGNCGTSAFPLSEAMRKRKAKPMAELGVRVDWSTPSEYLARARESGCSLNRAVLVGHNTLRAFALGLDGRIATARELSTKKREVRRAMDAGAKGISTGFFYPPGSFAPVGEAVALVRAAAESGGLYATHVRNEGDGLEEAIGEAIGIAAAAGARLQISHLKTAERRNWKKIGWLRTRLSRAIDEGVDLAADRYPYTSAATDLDAFLPPWVHDGGAARLMERLADPATRTRIRDEVFARESGRPPWGGIHLARIRSKEYADLEGLSLRAAAARRGIDSWDLFVSIVVADRGQSAALFDWMCEKNLREILSWPFVMVGSDAGIRDVEGPLARGVPHPRSFGTFARYLSRYVLSLGILSPAEGIRRLTSLPAERFRLDRRGLVREGFFADLVAFDPERLRDRARYGSPFRFSEGIDLVLVNGVAVAENGRHTGARPGRIV